MLINGTICPSRRLKEAILTSKREHHGNTHDGFVGYQRFGIGSDRYPGTACDSFIGAVRAVEEYAERAGFAEVTPERRWTEKSTDDAGSDVGALAEKIEEHWRRWVNQVAERRLKAPQRRYV